MSSIIRLSENIKNTGLVFFVLGSLGIVCGVVPPLVIGDGFAERAEGAANCFAISLIPFFLGGAMVAAYYLLHKVPRGHALVGTNLQLAKEGWHLNLIKPNAVLIPLNRRTVEIPETQGSMIELNTPDNGILGVSVTVTYTCDDQNPAPLSALQDIKELDRGIHNRVRSALENWIRQKPLPGTLKRAMSMKEDAESFVKARITNTNVADALVIHNDPSGFLNADWPVLDLGIRIHEIHLVAAKPIKNGTGKADWGDGDEMAFNAEKIFKQFEGQAGNLSNLRKLKEALKEKYQDEAEDIEDIYDQVRITMKEGE